MVIRTYCSLFFFFSSRRRHTRFKCDWSSDVCSSDLIENSRIAQVGVGLAVGKSAHQVIDLAGRTLMPGMIDCHAHPGGGDYDPGHIDEPIALMALRTLQALQNTLLAGVTTVRSAGAGHFLDVDVRDAINAGIAWGPRVLACGPMIRPTGGSATRGQLVSAACPRRGPETSRTSSQSRR